MKRPALLPCVVHQSRFRLVYSDGTILPRVCGAEDNPPEPPTPPAPAPVPPGPKGGDDALRADVARERDRRQAAEKALADHLASQSQAEQEKRTADAVAAAVAKAQEDHKALETARLAPVLARLVLTSARQAAEAAGVALDTKPEGAPETWTSRVDRFLTLVDLAGLTSEDGDVDTKKLEDRISAAAQANPEFVTRQTGTRMAVPGSSQGAALKPGAVSLSEATDNALGLMQKSLHGLHGKPANT